MPRPTATARRSAVLILFGEGPRGPDVLLIEKSAHLRSHAGQPAFPGGGVDPGDDYPVGTALREAEEEAGVDPDGVRVLATLPELFLGAVGQPGRAGRRLVGRPAGRDRRRSARGGAGGAGAAGRPGRPGEPLPAAAPRRVRRARRSASPTWWSGASPPACSTRSSRPPGWPARGTPPTSARCPESAIRPLPAARLGRRRGRRTTPPRRRSRTPRPTALRRVRFPRDEGRPRTLHVRLAGPCGRLLGALVAARACCGVRRRRPGRPRPRRRPPRASAR